MATRYTLEVTLHASEDEVSPNWHEQALYAAANEIYAGKTEGEVFVLGNEGPPLTAGWRLLAEDE